MQVDVKNTRNIEKKNYRRCEILKIKKNQREAIGINTDDFRNPLSANFMILIKLIIITFQMSSLRGFLK